MTVRYRHGEGRLRPGYVCQRDLVRHGALLCQLLAGGAAIDEAVGRLLVETVTPMALEVALSVKQQLEVRWEQTDRLRRCVETRESMEDGPGARGRRSSG